MGDLQPDGGSSEKTPQRTNGVRIAESSFSGVKISAPFFPDASDNKLSPSERAKIDVQLSDHIKKAHSLHGAVAAKRQATTELLFFASVGDISRIKRICETWGINVRTPSVS